MEYRAIIANKSAPYSISAASVAEGAHGSSLALVDVCYDTGLLGPVLGRLEAWQAPAPKRRTRHQSTTNHQPSPPQPSQHWL